MKKVRALLILGALILLGPCNICAATKVQEKTETGFANSLDQMYEYDNEDKIEAVAEDSDPTGVYVTNRLLVLSDNKIDSFNYAGIISAVSDGSNMYVIQFDSAKNAMKAYSTLYRNTSLKVEYDVYSNYIDEYESEEADDLEAVQETASGTTHYTWGTDVIGTDAYISYVNSTGITHSNVVVAVVDTGVDPTHPLIEGRTVAGYDYVNKDTDPMDGHGHGTHVAGIICDITKNLPNVKIMPVKAIRDDGFGSTSAVANGIKYAARHGAKVINLSVGGKHSALKDDAVNYAVEKGATVCVSSGNSGVDIDEEKYCPAHFKRAVVVGAIDKDETVANYSNYGTTVDVLAPGTGIKSAGLNGKYATRSGTSMAAPHVSAVAAILRTQYGNVTNLTMHHFLKRMCDGSNDGKNGVGVINMSNMLQDISNIPTAGELTKTRYAYTGSAISPSYIMKQNGYYLYKNKDYKIKLSNNKYVGRATVTFTGIGSYYGTKTLTYDIVPRKTSIIDVAAGKGQFRMIWQSQTRQTTGYHIMVSRNANFSEAMEYYTLKNTTTTKTVRNLLRRTKYYVRIRTYKDVDGVRYYSVWSGTRTVKTT